MFQEQLKTKIEEMDLKNVDMAKLRCQDPTKMLQTEVNQIQNNCGEFLWCIDNWENKLARSRNGIEISVFSDPFYSHRNGYKMCLRLEFGNVNLFLDLQILRGEFDNNLQWPFQHEVIFDLLNQETGLPHVSRVVKARKDPRNYVWKKPTKEKNKGIWFYFVDLSDLYLNAALSKGNQIWIRATTKIKTDFQ